MPRQRLFKQARLAQDSEEGHVLDNEAWRVAQKQGWTAAREHVGKNPDIPEGKIPFYAEQFARKNYQKNTGSSAEGLKFGTVKVAQPKTTIGLER